MNATIGAVAARAASAIRKPRPAHRPGDLHARDGHRAAILAGHMAEGCPSVVKAAHRMRITVADAERLWKRVRRELGRQAS